MGWVGGGERGGSVRVGEDEEAGAYGFGGHVWIFEEMSRGNVKGRTLGRLYKRYILGVDSGLG